MKLSSLAKIIAGIVFFVLLITFPFWYGQGKVALQPALSLDTPAIAQLKDKRCVEDTAFMRANHMKLLATWREAAVRNGKRLYSATDGRIFEARLSGTCLKCHSNKQQFCDRCHNYVGAKPNCFSCHIVPAEVRK
ncbi:MAG: sulfate reduction electron transfer complex DsrMKJOP subunit DsrJ [Deltaproteobacteria bacterium]